jgi:perosamine synthetase
MPRRKGSDQDVEPGAPIPGGGIPLSVPEIRGNEWKYIKQCLDTNWVSSVGGFVDRFEKSVASYIGVNHGVAAVNGTAALHIALLVAGIQPQDEVLVSTLTFIAPANAIRYVGAWPVFIDAEAATWQMDPQRVVDFLEGHCQYNQGELWNKATNRRVKAIMPVHILGHPVDLDPILETAAKYDLVVFEDASEGLGVRYKGGRVGSFGKVGCFSFNGNKLITTGGGGMLVTENTEIARKAKYLTTQAKDDPIEYVHHAIGYNYRLVNLLAAMGVAQMEQVESYIAAKKHIATRYGSALEGLPGIQLMPEAPWAESSFWLYTILVDGTQAKHSSRLLLQKFNEVKIQTRPLWAPIHLSKAHRGSSRMGGEIAEKLWRDSLSLPCSVGLREEDQDRVIAYLQQWLS